jgi:hypothetical protein
MISTPVSGSASIEMSGTWRNLPGKLFWKNGLAKTTLVPPPPPPPKPNKTGGTVGAMGGALVMLVTLSPHPVCSLMVLFLLRNVLVPPTAVTKGELPATDTASIPKSP